MREAPRALLVVCPSHRDRRELALLGPPAGTRFTFRDYASSALDERVIAEASRRRPIGDPLAEIERIVRSLSGKEIAGVISTDDYPGTALAAALAARLGLPGPDPAAALLCQHKFESRRLQRKYAPAAVPDFALLDIEETPAAIRYPVFVKPVKSYFSIGARLVRSAAELRREQRRWSRAGDFFRPFEALLKHYTGVEIGTRRLIAEAPLKGVQATLEGFVRDGRLHRVGIVDSVMFPGTRAFQRFEYPSGAPCEVQDRMAEIAAAVMTGIGYEGFFNIEFAYDAAAGALHIIEINPRLASQFADLYEKVDGVNSYSLLLDWAMGRAPRARAESGRFRMAASCVLRCFENRTVRRAPGAAELDDVRAAYPDVRVEVLTAPGRRLSEELQDGASFRYGIVNLGGDDRRHILARLREVRSRLTFDFAPARRASDTAAVFPGINVPGRPAQP
jgi:biotin carboxylase